MIKKSDIEKSLPELQYIKDVSLRKKVIDVWKKAADFGKWETLEAVPFTLLFKNSGLLIHHTRRITNLAKIIMEAIEENINGDFLIAGALLHDVGKFTEYERDSTSKIVQTFEGNRIRHPAMGLEIVSEFDLPIVVRQAIVFHSKEGDQINRLPEVDIIHRVDFLCFSPIKKIFEEN